MDNADRLAELCARITNEPWCSIEPSQIQHPYGDVNAAELRRLIVVAIDLHAAIAESVDKQVEIAVHAIGHIDRVGLEVRVATGSDDGSTSDASITARAVDAAVLGARTVLDAVLVR